MKLKAFFVLLALIITPFVFASPECPSIEALKAIPLTETLEREGRYMAIVWENKYGTDDQWTFAIGSFSDPQKALAKANKYLPSIELESGPDSEEGKTICFYTFSENDLLLGVAVNPSMKPTILGKLLAGRRVSD